MKMLKIVALTLAGTLPLLPAMATAQDDGDDGVTIIKFSRSAYTVFGEGNALEFTVVKDGPAEVQILWAAGATAPRIGGGGDGRAATVGKDFVRASGSLFFFADDTEKSFTVQTVADEEVGEPPEIFTVGLAFSPFDTHGNQRVEFAPYNGNHAFGIILDY